MKKCPLCEGTGYLGDGELKKTIKELRDKGLSMRSIAKVIGKGHTTVFYHLHK